MRSKIWKRKGPTETTHNKESYLMVGYPNGGGEQYEDCTKGLCLQTRPNIEKPHETKILDQILARHGTLD